MAWPRTFPRSGAALIAAALAVTGCAGQEDSLASGSTGRHGHGGSGPVVVATTTWQGAFARAAGAEDVTVVVPASAQHAPDYDPRPSDLVAVAEADFVLYAPYEPYAGQITEAAGADAELVEMAPDNDPETVNAEVTRLGELFGTQDAAAAWLSGFEEEYQELGATVRAAWPGDTPPAVVTQVFTAWAADLAGAETRATFGPEPPTAGQLAELSAAHPELVIDNAHMTQGAVLPDSDTVQVDIVNYPGEDLDLLSVHRAAAEALAGALAGAAVR
ncbi:zinc ABC transporter substrate-binding protein [Streptomyces sp. NPDC049881]|uniref:metal ABC transporter solute-binding protein, Zn/Mn family n=1 Tax=Streptomyces sp. NPDC049881 TaxID=3155778 RepID=UPI00343EBCEB